MTLSSELIKEACAKSKLKCQSITRDGVVAKIIFDHKSHFVYNFSLGLITNSESKICHDKDYQYQLLNELGVVPDSKTYLDPNNKKYQQSSNKFSYDQIAQDILSSFSLPVIIKKNRGSEGVNVFLCHNQQDILIAIKKIFSQTNPSYDHVLLAQKYILPKKEFRVVTYKGKIELVYEKKLDQAKKITNQSPFHNSGAKAVFPVDNISMKSLEEFIRPITKKFPIRYAGLDIIEDQTGKLWLIEINSDPSFAFFVRDNGKKDIVNLFSKIFTDLAHEESHL